MIIDCSPVTHRHKLHLFNSHHKQQMEKSKVSKSEQKDQNALRVLYEDKFMVITEVHIMLKKYYVPLMTSCTILLKDIKNITIQDGHNINNTWGTNSRCLNNWFHYDPNRKSKLRYLSFELKGSRIRPAATPEDIDKVFNILHTHFDKIGRQSVIFQSQVDAASQIEAGKIQDIDKQSPQKSWSSQGKAEVYFEEDISDEKRKTKVQNLTRRQVQIVDIELLNLSESKQMGKYCAFRQPSSSKKTITSKKSKSTIQALVDQVSHMNTDELYEFLDERCFYLEEDGKKKILASLYPVVMRHVQRIRKQFREMRVKNIEDFVEKSWGEKLQGVKYEDLLNIREVAEFDFLAENPLIRISNFQSIRGKILKITVIKEDSEFVHYFMNSPLQDGLFHGTSAQVFRKPILNSLDHYYALLEHHKTIDSICKKQMTNKSK